MISDLIGALAPYWLEITMAGGTLVALAFCEWSIRR